MNYRESIVFAVALALGQAAHADASFESTTQQTGGTFKQIAQMGGQFSPSASKSLLKAGSTITAVQGNRKAEISAANTVIFDLDKETVTRIDNQKKQYSVVSFDEMRQAQQKAAEQMRALLEEHKGDIDSATTQLPQQLQDNPASFDTKAETTGATRSVSGIATHEVLLTENMNFQSKGSNDKLTYYYKNDVWLADAEPPGWAEIQAFNKRLTDKIATDPAANPMMILVAARPGLAAGLKKMGEEQKKQQGVAVMVVQQLGGHAEGDSLANSGSAAASSGPSLLGGTGSSMTNEVVSNTASEAAQKEASQLNGSGKLGIFSSSLMDAAVGAFTHHSQELTKTATSSASSAVAPKPSSGKPPSVDKVMMEQTTVLSNFSNERIPASAFEIPAGYSKVDWQGTAPKLR
jgi:hypothetical protein